MMDFRIDTFLAVCRYMNFTKAADKLNITQPGVSQHIHYLESFYGAKLFCYEGKKIFLTAEGKILYNAAITMKHDNIYLKNIIKDFDVDKNRLVFGATLTIGEFVMAKHIEKYISLYPTTAVQMLVGNTSELLERLNASEIDFAIVEGNFNKTDYEHIVYSVERYIPVCSRDYVFKKEPLELRDLLSERIIIREAGSGTREILEKNLEYRNLGVEDFKHKVEIGGFNAIKTLVKAGFGITFVYEAVVKEELEAGTIRELDLKDFEVTHDFTFIWNKGSVFTERYREICKLLSL